MVKGLRVVMLLIGSIRMHRRFSKLAAFLAALLPIEKVVYVLGNGG